MAGLIIKWLRCIIMTLLIMELVSMCKVMFYTNTIEGFWAGLKRGVLGIYHSWSKKYLQDYVDEFVFRYNTRDYSDSERFNLLISNACVRTKYRELIYGY